MNKAVTGLARFRWPLIAVVAAVVLAAIPSSAAYIAGGTGGIEAWWMYYSRIGPYYLLWALLSPIIYHLTTQQLNSAHGWGRCLLGHVMLLAILSFALGIIVHSPNWQYWLLGPNAAGYHTMSISSYLLILLGVYVYTLEARAREREELISQQQHAALELETALAGAQLEALRGQMNPHFLFNSLNCIGALIESGENERAYQVLEDLGILLRSVLELRHKNLVSLDEELTFVRRYVSMEQVRFGARLDFDVSTESWTKDWQVPPFLLQPLIENAVKHAVAISSDPVHIEITAKKLNDTLLVDVCNSRPDRAASEQKSTGVGLSNLRERLKLIYGDRALVEYQLLPSSTRVRVVLPGEIRDQPANQKANGAPGKLAHAVEAPTGQIQNS